MAATSKPHKWEETWTASEAAEMVFVVELDAVIREMWATLQLMGAL